MERSRELRKALRPYLKWFLRRLLDTYAAALEKKGADAADYVQRQGGCYYLHSFLPIKIGSILAEMLLPTKESKDSVMDELFDILVENFRAPAQAVKREITEFVKLHAGNESLDTGTAVQKLFKNPACNWKPQASPYYNVSTKGLAMHLLLAELNRNRRIPFRVPNVERWLSNGDLFRIVDDNDDLMTLLRSDQEQLAKGANLTYDKIVAYFRICSSLPLNGQGMYPPSATKGEGTMIDCHHLTQEMTTSYKQVLKIMKYFQQATSAKVQEQSDLKDLQVARKRFVVSSPFRQKENDTQLLHHVDPAIIACKFGKKIEQIDMQCSHFIRTLTSDGIGHTFNGIPFWKMYRKTSWSEIFATEIVDQVGHQNDELPRSPDFNGPGFGLEFLVDLTDNSYYHHHLLEDNTRLIAIHNPSDIADLSGEVLEVTAGIHYTILVTQSIISTDASLEKLGQVKRGCFTTSSDSHNLTLFHTYRHANCLFECYLRSAYKTCGCIPWDYGRINETAPICHLKGTTCFKNILSADRDPKHCPNCLMDCTNTMYTYTVLSKPISLRALCSYSNRVCYLLLTTR